MIVVSNSTPLIHFGTIDKLNILKSIYKSIFITRSVCCAFTHNVLYLRNKHI